MAEATKIKISAGQRIRQVLQTIVLAVAALYFGRDVLIPLAMAILLSFLLTPVVTWLERNRVPRVPAVVLVMAVIFTALSVGGLFVARELASLGENLDDYKENLKGRVKSVLPGRDSPFMEIQNIASEVTKELDKEAKEESKHPAGEGTAISNADQPANAAERVAAAKASLDSAPFGKTGDSADILAGTAGDAAATSESAEEDAEPIPVKIVSDTSAFDTIGAYVSTFLTPLANLAIITVLVIFMLIQREDLRNRLVRLAGKKLTLTTRTLDEVGTRISRYLLMLCLVNGSFGAAIALGLLLIGVPYALLWGTLAATLRFIPYVGPILAASFPVAMSLVHFPADDLWHPSLTVGLIVVLELISNNIIEPMAYGRSTGVSVVAILVSATFWTWVWGPVGLMLSVPLTVVLAVLGEHVPALETFGVLLSDKPALATHMSFYQRLLAGDFDEASSLIDEHTKTHCLRETYDDVLVPALVLAERDHRSGDLEDDEQNFIWQSTRDLVEEGTPAIREESADCKDEGKAGLRAYVVGCPAHDMADELSLRMLGHLLEPRGGEFEVFPSAMLVSEMVARLAKRPPAAVCVSSLGPVGGRQTRYLCKRLKQQLPQVRIVVGRWGFRGDRDKMVADLRACGADQVITTLDDARDILQRIVPLPAADGAPRESSGKAALGADRSSPVPG